MPMKAPKTTTTQIKFLLKDAFAPLTSGVGEGSENGERVGSGFCSAVSPKTPASNPGATPSTNPPLGAAETSLE